MDIRKTEQDTLECTPSLVNASEAQKDVPSPGSNESGRCELSYVDPNFDFTDKFLKRLCVFNWVVGILLAALFSLTASTESIWKSASLYFILFFYCAGQTWYAFGASNRRKRLHTIELTTQGITFSSQWRVSMLDRLHRSWDDVHSIQYLTNGCENRRVIGWADCGPGESDEYAVRPELIFDFKSGGQSNIMLRGLTHQQGQELLVALRTFGNPACFSGEIMALEKSILLQQGGTPTFTRLWEEDLSSRYVATNYSPLQGNKILQSGRYRVCFQFAAGGMSAVYLARTEGNAKVVLKEAVLPRTTSEAHRTKSRELFQREAYLLLKLNHPQIAKVLDVFSEAGRDYLVLEHVPGQTLRRIVEKCGKVDEARALEWAEQISDILDYLHTRQPAVVHRDLTPDNLILREDGKIVLVDFGAANEYVGTATGTFIGKQCYMAPEQLRGKAQPSSDIYSFGATLHFLLTGCDPIPLSSSQPRLQESELSEPVNQLVSACTRLESSERPDSMEEVAATMATITRKQAPLLAL